ncbi:MAG: hypothetical protein P4L68_10080 [Methylovirgula sp.]|jgi:hypothetical protein|nr:hypothetical protein [Methylovirgula sp.]
MLKKILLALLVLELCACGFSLPSPSPSSTPSRPLNDMAATRCNSSGGTNC